MTRQGEFFQPNLPFEKEDTQLDILDRGADKPAGRLDFLGNTTCPMKAMLRRGLQDTLLAMEEKKESQPLCYVPSGCNGIDHFREIREATDIVDLPGSIMTKGFGDFLDLRFRHAFAMKGYFRYPEKQTVNQDFEGKGFEDPEQDFWTYAVFPYVFLVDEEKLRGRPVPSCWQDLSRDEFRDDIIIGGTKDCVSKVPFLYLQKKHGKDGVESLAANVKDAWHNATIAKTAGNGSPNGACIYIVPWFFARMCPRTEKTRIVWPKDGAVTGPMYLFAKTSERERLSVILRYLTGTDYGIVSAANFYPALTPGLTNQLPKEASLEWLGWDYLRSNSLKELNASIDAVFRKKWPL